MAALNDTLKIAVAHALAGDWNAAHKIAQDCNDPTACWIHAVLHKMEGDASNSRYWYAHTQGRRYEDFRDPQQELREIARLLDAA